MPRVNVGARSRDQYLGLIVYLIYLHAFAIVKPYLRVVGRPGALRLVIPLSRHFEADPQLFLKLNMACIKAVHLKDIKNNVRIPWMLFVL